LSKSALPRIKPSQENLSLKDNCLEGISSSPGRRGQNIPPIVTVLIDGLMSIPVIATQFIGANLFVKFDLVVNQAAPLVHKFHHRCDILASMLSATGQGNQSCHLGLDGSNDAYPALDLPQNDRTVQQAGVAKPDKATHMEKMNDC
jgi:hypothetical protein